MSPNNVTPFFFESTSHSVIPATLTSCQSCLKTGVTFENFELLQLFHVWGLIVHVVSYWMRSCRALFSTSTYSFKFWLTDVSKLINDNVHRSSHDARVLSLNWHIKKLFNSDVRHHFVNFRSKCSSKHIRLMQNLHLLRRDRLDNMLLDSRLEKNSQYSLMIWNTDTSTICSTIRFDILSCEITVKSFTHILLEFLLLD